MSAQAWIEQILADPIGSYPAATVACFDPTAGQMPRRTLDESRTVAFLEKLAAAGAPALLIAASTGHGHLRTVDELAQWFRIAAKARLGESRLTALLRPEDGADANARLAKLLAELGFVAAFVRPGRDLPAGATDSEVARNMQPAVKAVAEAGLAVGLYSIPDVSGVAMSPAAAAEVLRGPGGERVVAIKVTEASYERSTLAFLRDERLARLKIVQGWDPHLARAMQDGPAHDAEGRQRCGVTSGPMSFAVHQYLHMLKRAAERDWEEVAAAQQAVTSLFAAMQDDPGKFADLQRAKYIMGLGQPLTGQVTSKQFDAVLKALQSLPRAADRERLARSLDLMGDGPFHHGLAAIANEGQPEGQAARGTQANPADGADAKTTVMQLRDVMRAFVAERDWRQFHSPKNLSMSLAIEAAELMEHFQWIDIGESRRVKDDAQKLAGIRDEVADVLCYLLALANELELDLSAAVRDKMQKNAQKYPVEQSRGRYDAPKN